jgi:integrase
MANKEGHRRFGSIRKLPSGRYQIRYPGPDGRLRTGRDTYSRTSDADRALTLIEAGMIAGEWTDPQRAKVKLADYAGAWIDQRPGLRPRTVDLYRWLLDRHITPHLGGVPIGKLTTPMIREWRATLLGNGVSLSMSAKAYRLLRAVMMTAVEEDKILPRNPCRVRGAGEEHAPERPVLTVAQVFELAERIGRRPVGNLRQLPAGGYRLRFGRDGVMRTSPKVYGSRAEAERALWKMAGEGRADCEHDRRYRAFVLLATFASLRWGEVTALQRCDLDLRAGTVRIRQAFSERRSPGGKISLGPPKSKAARRVVGVPAVIIPALTEHMTLFVAPEPDALIFRGPMGGPVRRGNFNRAAGWSHVVAAIGAPGLHFHDLRHTGNTFAAATGAGLKDLMARMGHDSERAAMIYQHEARGADKAITGGIDAHVQAERDQDDDGDDGSAGVLVPAG